MQSIENVGHAPSGALEHLDSLLDEALAETFPASDVVAISIADGGASSAARELTHVSNGRRTAVNKPEAIRNQVKDSSHHELATPTDLSAAAVKDIAAAMNAILADVFALYLKTKNFHWHLSGPHFRDYHLMFDEQGDQIFAMTDPIAERVRKLGAPTLHSTGQIARTQRILDNDAEYVEPSDMLAELRDDNKVLAGKLREAHGVCDEGGDVATASLIEVWIDETERRTWFLYEASRHRDSAGR
jgi:starvation-inducible DNA-binding protein